LVTGRASFGGGVHGGGGFHGGIIAPETVEIYVQNEAFFEFR